MNLALQILISPRIGNTKTTTTKTTRCSNSHLDIPYSLCHYSEIGKKVWNVFLHVINIAYCANNLRCHIFIRKAAQKTIAWSKEPADRIITSHYSGRLFVCPWLRPSESAYPISAGLWAFFPRTELKSMAGRIRPTGRLLRRHFIMDAK